MSISVDAEIQAQRINEARAELAALRNEIKRLTDLVNLFLSVISPKDARFYAQAQALEEQIGQAQKE